MLKDADLSDPALTLWPQRTPSDDGVEFLDEAAAALRSPGGVAEFEGEASHRTEIGGRVALVHVIEQGGANIAHSMNVDPGLSVGQPVNPSARGALFLIENAVKE